MDYVLKHWRGEFSLATSFWVNFILLTAILRLLERLSKNITIFENPQHIARSSFVYFIVVLAIIAPWQIVGLWRAYKHHKEQSGKNFWARAFRGFIMFVLLLFVAAFGIKLPEYRDVYRLGFMKDQYADYTLALKNEGTLIYLKGSLGYGVSKDVEKLLRKYPKVRGIVLDSRGGEAYEGRQLSKMITSYSLNTYSFAGCCSAATTAFIGGNKRFLGSGASMGFHQPHSVYSSLAKYMNLEKEQEKDKLIFKRQGVTQEFLDKVNNTPNSDLWYPSIDELLEAGVIHGVVDPCDILEANNQGTDANTTSITDDISSTIPIEVNKPRTIASKPRDDVNIASHIAKLKQAAEAGDANSMSELAGYYALGRGVKQDYNETANWLRKAAEQGNAVAQSNLGYCYEEGYGVERDSKEAVRWYRKAAEQGYANAQCRLGVCYASGQGVEHDEKEAVKWYLKAAEQGNAYAQSNVAFCYMKGNGVGQDYKEAVKWYRKAAEQGIAQAAGNLGSCYYKGDGVLQDYKEAVKWYRKAAEQGYPNAQWNLGLCYDNGRGVEKNYNEAVKWYRKAAEQGMTEAQYNLGCCYATGRGVEGDGKEAVKWYRKAAEQGDAMAQNSLGACYSQGYGVVKDYVEAYKWFLISETTNHGVNENKNTIAQKMTQEQIGEAQNKAKQFLAQQK